MSKYIIDIPKTVGMLEAVGSVHYTYFDGIQCRTIVLKSDEIEELNSDSIMRPFQITYICAFSTPKIKNS